ncbi:MAG: hypothetical protein V7K24_16045 [Nostoc sp.]
MNIALHKSAPAALVASRLALYNNAIASFRLNDTSKSMRELLK